MNKHSYKMKISLFFLGLLLPLLYPLQAQDQLILTDGTIQEVTVKKVAPTTINYSFKGETLENIVDKTDVDKIIFKNGREQVFSGSREIEKDEAYEYPPMASNEGAILPFAFVFDGTVTDEEGKEAQEYYYRNLMRKPEYNIITYQDPETTQRRLRAAGITSAQDYQDYEMNEIAKIVGADIIITGKITVDYRSTTSNSYGSTTVKVDEKKKKGKAYSSNYTTSTDEFNTSVLFRIYDNGEKVVDITRRPFLATTRNNYTSALNYLMKRTPYYQK